jgi:hypothetical protein
VAVTIVIKLVAMEALHMREQLQVALVILEALVVLVQQDPVEVGVAHNHKLQAVQVAQEKSFTDFYV